MKTQLVVAVIFSGVLLLPLGCTDSAPTPVSPKDGGTGGTGGSGFGSGGAGGSGFGSGGSFGSGGTIAGSGGAGGATAGTGGAATDGGADDGGNADGGGAETTPDAGDDGAMPGDAPVEMPPDDGTFPPNGPIGSCDPLNWMTSASSAAANNPVGSAIDGLMTTRWSTGAGQAAGQYFEIDFGGFVRLSQLTLNNTGSPGDHPRGYELRTSRDDADFSTLIASGMPGDTAPAGNLVTIDIPPRAVRFLRIQMTGFSGSWWSIHELGAACQIPGPNGTWTTDKPSSEGLCGPGSVGADGGVADAPADGSGDGGTPEAGATDGATDAATDGATTDAAPNPFDRTQWTVTASNTSTNPGDVIGHAIDGDITTRWSSGRAQSGNEFFKVNLGSVGCVSQVRIVSSGTDFAASYVVSVSQDDQTYVRVAKGTGTNVLQIGFAPRLTRFLRINQVGNSGSWWSIDELAVLP